MASSQSLGLHMFFCFVGCPLRVSCRPLACSLPLFWSPFCGDPECANPRKATPTPKVTTPAPHPNSCPSQWSVHVRDIPRPCRLLQERQNAASAFPKQLESNIVGLTADTHQSVPILGQNSGMDKVLSTAATDPPSHWSQGMLGARCVGRPPPLGTHTPTHLGP